MNRDTPMASVSCGATIVLTLLVPAHASQRDQRAPTGVIPASMYTLESERRAASAAAVKPLLRVFNQTGQRAVAVMDPREDGFFVAAVYTGTDLFLVRAHHPAAEELSQRIRAGQQQRVFFALRATPTPTGKFYVFDAGADGIHATARSGDAVDEVREEDVRVVRFSGDASGQHLTRLEYAEKLAEADQRYADLLKLLVSKGV